MPEPELIAALALFGLVVVCPLVAMLMRHQREMAKILNREGGDETIHRIQALEHEVRYLRSELHARTIQDDTSRELKERLP